MLMFTDVSQVGVTIDGYTVTHYMNELNSIELVLVLSAM